MKKVTMILPIGLLAMALSLILAPSSGATPKQLMGTHNVELSIDNPNISYHHHRGRGTYGRGRQCGGR